MKPVFTCSFLLYRCCEKGLLLLWYMRLTVRNVCGTEANTPNREAACKRWIGWRFYKAKRADDCDGANEPCLLPPLTGGENKHIKH